METVSVKRTSNARFFRASIDNVRLQFDVDGKAIRSLPEGKHHLVWSVLGNPGSTYSIEITAPAHVTCKGGGTLDEEGIDFGFCNFVIN